MALRLETISARDLVHLLAKAGRLGYKETDVVEDDAGDPLVHEVYEGFINPSGYNSSSDVSCRSRS